MTRHRVSPLEAHLGYWLRYVSNQVSHAFALKVATHGVSVAEWVVLRELFDEPETTASQLADKLGMTRGAISKIVDRLEAKALMTRTADVMDARYPDAGAYPGGRGSGAEAGGVGRPQR